jgi:hypothetical protein
VTPAEQQLSIYDAAAHARRTDPATSHAAAHALADKATMMRALLNVFAGHTGGLTSEEACHLAGYGPADGAWKRVSDLKTAGHIIPTGDTRAGGSGRQQAVLAITEEGRKALR